MELLGRDEDIYNLIKKQKSYKTELVVVLGRRRVGKTFLINQTFINQFYFKFSGFYKGTQKEHISRFFKAMSEQLTTPSTKPFKTPRNWFDCLDILKTIIEQSRSKKKKIIFLDEFPWMSANKSRILTAFSSFYNYIKENRNDVLFVICGSAASWMINKILKNKGGLHNRVSDRIFIEPFNLYETEQFLKRKNIIANRFEIAQLYMAWGGIPFYLEQMDTGESVVQTINRNCFRIKSILQMEFNELYASLFDNYTKHEIIITALAKHPTGLTREALLKSTNLNSGGGFTELLDELEQSNFITSFTPLYKNNNDKLYRLIDFYSLFYLKFILPNKGKKGNVWLNLHQTPAINSWYGYAFENLCMIHIAQIKKALKIEGIYSTESAWHHAGNDVAPGAQIDLLIDRADNIINICEMKFSKEPFVITEAYATKIKLKIASFNHFTNNKKAIHVIMITANGLVRNIHSSGLIQNEIILDDLFEKK